MSYLKGKSFYDDGDVVISGNIEEMRHFTTTPHYCKCFFDGPIDDVVFRDIMFVGCTFDACIVTNSTFDNCKFIDCTFSSMLVSNTKTSNLVFSKCTFECIEGPFAGNIIDDCYMNSPSCTMCDQVIAVHTTENYTIFETMGGTFHASGMGNTFGVLWDLGISDERTTFMVKNQIRRFLLPAVQANKGKVKVETKCPISTNGRVAVLDCIPKIASNVIYRTAGNDPVDLTVSEVHANMMLPHKLEFWMDSVDDELSACVYVKGA